MKRLLFAPVICLALMLPAVAQPKEHREKPATEQRSQDRIVKEVRHVLVMQPYYSVFDDLSYKVEGGTVTLMGAVTNGSLQTSAEKDVSKIEGVDRVVNQIKLLPASGGDDRLRRQLYRTIFGYPMLSRYAWAAVPSIHIIVENGHVTLTGVVDNKTDSQVAEMQAKSVSGAFTVDNQLRVEKP